MLVYLLVTIRSTGLPLFNDEIKFTISSEVVCFHKKKFSLASWRTSSNDSDEKFNCCFSLLW